MGKHTPGPWRLELIQEWPFGVRIMAGSHEILRQDGACFATQQKTRADNEAGVGFGDNKVGFSRSDAMKSISEQDANARLIAAAPDLLAAAKEAIDTLPSLKGPAYSALRAAIAMAVGTN